MRKRKLWSICCVLCFLAASCAKEEPVSGPGQRTTLSFWSIDQSTFDSYFGESLLAALPDVEVKIASKASAVRGAAPDVLSLGMEELKKWSSEGKLVDLDPHLRKSGFDLGAFEPDLIAQVRAAGGGKLYAIPVTIDSYALLFNKDLFDRYQIPYPANRMTWYEILALAERFPSGGSEETRDYGIVFPSHSYHQGTPFRAVEWIGQFNGLQMVDPSGAKLLLNSPEWRPVFASVVRLWNSGASSFYSDFSDPGGYNLFTLGRAAMTVSNLRDINLLRGYTAENPDARFSLGVVASPVMDSDRDKGGLLVPETMIAVSQDSRYMDKALKLVQYLASESVAKKRAALFDGALTARNTATTTPEGVDISAFTALEPNTIDSYRTPQEFQQQLAALADARLQAVHSGKLTLDEAIAHIQLEGQRLLNAVLSPTPEKTNGK